MKVVHIVAIYQRSAGTSLFASEVARELVENGVESVVACPNPQADGLFIPDSRVPVVSVDSILRGRSGDVSVLHIHGIWTPILHRVSQWAHAHRIPVVWSPHGMLMPWALRSKFVKKLIGLVLYQYRDLCRAQLIHATTDIEAAQVRRLGLHNPQVVEPLGVNMGWSDGMLRERRAALRGENRMALFVSRINPGKGLVNLIRAWHTVKPQGWRLAIAGPDEENHLAELYALCDSLHIPYSPAPDKDGDHSAIHLHLPPVPATSVEVAFLGPVYGSAKDDLYASADLFVLPSFSENFSSVVVEALVASVPVVTTTATPWQCIVEKGCGWCVAPREEALSSALREAIGLPNDKLREMGAAGRKFALAAYDWRRIGKSMLQEYRSLSEG